ncbi:ABC transporter substrate-binding protein [Paenibacillus darwinianus]|uniref:ABC transporter substrate-binding protein n=1 Tax=Paenibacillus darwinianus TaxID=1380763 RepID=UPI000449FCBA|nr:extracellular solute-binding protein [Paenibacillus darwinianus]EXX91060.1 ABC transporter substrate-binding protein [Paenibacillus darwinianus]EXX91998.1 ABC transporter substrate-binding protein [Paenibacillus darwinianus]
MKKMKVLSLVLMALMLIVTACGGNNTGSNNPANENVNANNGAATNAEAPAEDPKEEAAADLGGRVIRMAAWWDMTPKGETAGEKARLEKIAEIEKKYNVKIEFVNVPFEEYMNKFTTTVLAGEPFADIVQLEYKSAIAPVLKGQLLPLSEFTTADNDINNAQKLTIKLPPLAGGEYGFDTPGLSSVGIHYNRDLFKKLGLPDLQDVYNSGEWTWDKFLEIAKQATRDTDNDGKTDTYGFSGWTGNIVTNFAASNGGKIADDETGKEGLSDPRVIEALEFVNRLYNEENVVFVKGGNKTDYNEFNTYKDGNVAMFIGYEWMLGDQPFEVGVVPMPIGPQGTKDFTYANTALGGKFIPKGIKDPQVVYQIFEEMQDVPPTEEYVGQDYMESKYSTEADIQMIRDNIQGTGMVYVHEGYPDFPIGAVMEDIIVNNVSVSSTVEKYKQQAQASMDKLKP